MAKGRAWSTVPLQEEEGAAALGLGARRPQRRGLPRGPRSARPAAVHMGPAPRSRAAGPQRASAAKGRGGGRRGGAGRWGKATRRSACGLQLLLVQRHSRRGRPGSVLGEAFGRGGPVESANSPRAARRGTPSGQLEEGLRQGRRDPARAVKHLTANMDPEAFLDLANQVTKLKMFPYFDIAHSVLCALHVREDLGPGKATPGSAGRGRGWRPRRR